MELKLFFFKYNKESICFFLLRKMYSREQHEPSSVNKTVKLNFPRKLVKSFNKNKLPSDLTSIVSITDSKS